MNITPKTHIPSHSKHDCVLLRNWGFYFQNKGNNKSAISYLNECKENHGDAFLHYYLSLAENAETHVREALKNATAAREKYPLRRFHELEVKTMIDNNRFADASMIAHDYIRKFKHLNTEQLENNLCLAKEILKSCCSSELRKFYSKNLWISEYEEKRKLTLNEDSDRRPLWKKLRAENKCDVVSVTEKVEEKKSPVQKAKQALALKILAQTFLQRSWRDMIFLKNLKNDEKIKSSLPKLNDFIAEQYGKTKAFMKMLHERNPLYTHQERNDINFIRAKFKEDHKYRLQYQSHRDVLALLRAMRALRAAGAVNRMQKFMSEVATKFLSIKTVTVLPGLMEIINEVYNIYALTLADSYVVPPNMLQIPSSQKLHLLLKIPATVNKTVTKFEFGDKSTSIDLTEDLEMSNYRKKLTDLENQLQHSRYEIERCYLYHEIANLHILYRRTFEAVSAANKGVIVAQSRRHGLWELLNVLCIVKAHTVIGKFEQEKKSLELALELAEKLKDQRLITFLNVCLHVSNMRSALDMLEAPDSNTSSKRNYSSNNSSIYSIIRN